MPVDHAAQRAKVTPFTSLPIRLSAEDPLRWWNQLGTEAGRVYLVRPSTLSYEPLEWFEVKHVARATGLAPRLVVALHRAAFQLNWHILVRPIKHVAWHHIGHHDRLPKPPQIHTKTDTRTGCIRLDEAGLAAEIANGNIDAAYAHVVGLTIDAEGFLVNRRGQRFYSDVDLYDIIDGQTGRQVNLGRGTDPGEGAENRKVLDAMINELHAHGAAFALIQHGAHRQWAEAGRTRRPGEKDPSRLRGLDWRIVAFRPQGVITYLDDQSAVESFLAALAKAPMSPWW